MQSSYLRSSDAQTNGVLLRIDEKLKQLKTKGISHSDRKLLKTRFQIIWGEDDGTQTVKAGTAWRKSRARDVYTEIQKISGHLFLPAVLAITPTECTKKSTESVLDHILHIDDHEPFCFTLNSTAKKFLETAAVEHGFSGNRGYLHFMQTVFPQS
ncbi:hypothetical protein PMIN01_08124 [Paraphaeosphaeria minitans]|uniref:Uncharacterized protein n=1 Tax=Paraphaeosphaeria minitans TaxID=565426 RepID=A0A9P6KPH9_9PLEO|nr:hypothetical protein PMIN01_08124 [Paraphaeosphaeria minitans]